MRSPPVSRPDAWQRLVAAEPPPWVLRHCLCVEGLACAMAEHASHAGAVVDHELVARGALLHDIGRSQSQGLDHAYVGADMLRQPPAMPEPLCRIVERHTGAGVPSDEAAKAGLPARQFTPETLEEKIVAHADNLLSGDKRMSLDQVVAKYEAKGLEAAGQRIVALHIELEDLLGTSLDELEPVLRTAP